MKVLLPGTKLVFNHEFSFYLESNLISSYETGDEISIVEPTRSNPHNHKARGLNYLVTSKYGTSVWTSIPLLLERKVIRIMA